MCVCGGGGAHSPLTRSLKDKRMVLSYILALPIPIYRSVSASTGEDCMVAIVFGLEEPWVCVA